MENEVKKVGEEQNFSLAAVILEPRLFLVEIASTIFFLWLLSLELKETADWLSRILFLLFSFVHATVYARQRFMFSRFNSHRSGWIKAIERRIILLSVIFVFDTLAYSFFLEKSVSILSLVFVPIVYSLILWVVYEVLKNKKKNLIDKIRNAPRNNGEKANWGEPEYF